MTDTERTLEFEFVRATENAALNPVHWLGRGEKELADAAACDAIYGVFDNVNICGQVVIGEGIKDNAPGIFLGDRLGTWPPGSPVFDIGPGPHRWHQQYRRWPAQCHFCDGRQRSEA
jgi:fructose-1,6-bisphosphatase II